MEQEKFVHVLRDALALVGERYESAEVIQQSQKEDRSVVTEVDMLVHDFLVGELCTTGIPILSEEGDHGAAMLLADGAVWVIDPLDGTLDFLQRTGEFAVMVALVQKGAPILAGLALPATGEVVVAEKGCGTFRYGEDGASKRLTVSSQNIPAGVRLLESRNHPSTALQAISRSFGTDTVTRCGSLGVKLLRIASGDADAYANATTRMGWWDVAAPQLILEEAGGRVTGISGEPLRYHGPGVKNVYGLLATNGALHEAAVQALADAQEA